MESILSVKNLNVKFRLRGRVLHAIRVHTTGCEAMSLLDKVLYVADMIEPGRAYPGVDEIRAAARQSLDGAVLAAMRRKLAYVKSTGRALDPRTAQALAWMEQNRAETLNGEK